MLGLASFLGGYVEADPLVAALVIGAVVVAAAAFLVLRLRAHGRKGAR